MAAFANNKELSGLPIEVSPADFGAPAYEEDTGLEDKPNAALAGVTPSRVRESTLSAPRQQSRLLDESDVLPGEASFATVMLNQRIALDTYSPVTEFLAKFNLTWRRLALAMLVVVSVCAVTTVILKITGRSVGSSHSKAKAAAENSAQTKGTATQTEQTAFGESPAVSETDRQVSGSLTSTGVSGAELNGAVAVTLGKSRKEFIEEPESEAPTKATPEETKSEAPPIASLQNAKSVVVPGVSADHSQRRGAIGLRGLPTASKPEIARQEVLSPKGKVKASRSQAKVKSRAGPSSISAYSELPKPGAGPKESEAESQPAPVTSQAQRLRRVGVKADSEPKSSETGSATVSPPNSSKPKVIQWP